MVTTRSQDGSLPSKSDSSTFAIARLLRPITNESTTNVRRRKANKKSMVKTTAPKIAKKPLKGTKELFEEKKQRTKTPEKDVKGPEKITKDPKTILNDTKELEGSKYLPKDAKHPFEDVMESSEEVKESSKEARKFSGKVEKPSTVSKKGFKVAKEAQLALSKQKKSRKAQNQAPRPAEESGPESYE